MASSPQRPFVPHRTPSRQRPAIGTSEFRLARPFVPGTEHQGNDVVQHPSAGSAAAAAASGSAAARADSDSSILSIENFFHRPAQTQAPTAPQSSDDEFDDGSELPPVEHFLDPLPRVGDFAPETSEGVEATGAGHDAAGGPPPSEWAHTDWQEYDWRSVAALAETADTAALNAWASTDWDAAALGAAKDQQRIAAQAIAAALQQIAKRIRDGELAVPIPGSATDPGTIAATLAALLGIRQ